MIKFLSIFILLFVLFDTKAMKEVRRNEIKERRERLQPKFEQIKSFIYQCETSEQRRSCWKMIGKFRKEYRDMKHTIELCNIWWEMSEAPQFLDEVVIN